MVLLADQLRSDLGEGGSAPVDLPVAVNADSLATWFEPVLGVAAGWDDTRLHLEVEDEEYSASMKRPSWVMTRALDTVSPLRDWVPSTARTQFAPPGPFS